MGEIALQSSVDTEAVLGTGVGDTTLWASFYAS